MGAGNIGNLHVLESAKVRGIVILDSHARDGEEWDFTGGKAAAILDGLGANGAIPVREVSSAIAAVARIIEGVP